MLRLSHAHLCSEHLAECDFINFMAEYQSLMAFASKPKPWNKRQQDKDNLVENPDLWNFTSSFVI